MSVLVSIRGLRKRFADRQVLDGIDLDVAAGEIVAILGPSGGGKSTLLRTINGLTPFDEGTITIAGDVVSRPSRDAPESRRAAARARRLLGMIFQDFQLFPHMTALENVAVAPIEVLGRPRAVAEARARELLARVGLEDRGSARPRELSGGQKQRVAIARALAMEPRALLCDEITSALDPELKGEVLAVVEDLRRDGMTILLVTHEIGFARRAADRVVILDAGKILEEGPAAEVLERPRTDRARRFLERVLG